MAVSKKDNFKNSLCYYIPLVFPVFVLLKDNNKNEDTIKHISYSLCLFFSYLIGSFVLGWGFFIKTVLFLIYIGTSIYLGYNTYNGKDIKIKQFDILLKKIKEVMKN